MAEHQDKHSDSPRHNYTGTFLMLSFLSECEEDSHCLTCPARADECATCDSAANAIPTRYLRLRDKKCVEQSECDPTMSLFWNITATQCQCKIPILYNSSLIYNCGI